MLIQQMVSQMVRRQGMIGVSLLGLGLLFLFVSGVYYAYGSVVKSRLDWLSYSAERPSSGFLDRIGALGSLEHPNVVASNTPNLDVGNNDVQGPSQIHSTDVSVSVVRQINDKLDSDETAHIDFPGLIGTGALRLPQKIPVNGYIEDVDLSDAKLLIASIGPPELFEDDGGSASIDDLSAAWTNARSGLPTIESTRQSSGDYDIHQPVGKLSSGLIGNDSSRERHVYDLVSRVAVETVADEETDNFEEDYQKFQTAFFSSRLLELTSMVDASEAEAATYSAPNSSDLASLSIPAIRVRIPAIGVDSKVDGLRVLLSGDHYEWETPKNVVGHIPTTAKPSDSGQGWYFGHLESLVKGEGNVFRRLPEIPGLLKDYPVYVFLETENRKYAYQVYLTEVVHEDDLQITDSGKQDITLVTCTPRLYYDHRLLVTAALVGVGDV